MSDPHEIPTWVVLCTLITMQQLWQSDFIKIFVGAFMESILASVSLGYKKESCIKNKVDKFVIQPQCQYPDTKKLVVVKC